MNLRAMFKRAVDTIPAGWGYGWMIESAPDEPSSVGVSGPRGRTFSAAECRVWGVEFEMRDGDDIPLYRGWFVCSPDYSAVAEGFEPLEDYGTPNAGATAIYYRRHAGAAWEVL